MRNAKRVFSKTVSGIIMTVDYLEIMGLPPFMPAGGIIMKSGYLEIMGLLPLISAGA